MPLQNAQIIIIKKQNQVIVDGKVYDISPRLRNTLEFFCSRQNQVVTKNEIFENVWGDIIVSGDSISQSISQLRKILAKAGIDKNFIRTVRGIGYQIGEITDIEIIDQLPGGSTSNKLPLYPHQWAIPFITSLIFLIATTYSSPSTNECCWNATRLTYTSNWERKPTLSPLANYVTYTRYSSDGTSSIFILNVNNNESEKRLGRHINANYFAPIFDPTEQVIYAMRINEDDTCNIVSIKIDLNIESAFSECSYTLHPRLSVNNDGTKIAMPSSEDTSSIIIIDLVNGTQSVIYKESGYNVLVADPIFDNEDNIIFVRRFLDGNSEFVKLNTNNKSIEILLYNTSDVIGPTLYNNNIIYTIRDSNGNNMYAYNMVSGELSNLPIDDPMAAYPSVSVDGNTMAYGTLNNRRELGYIYINESTTSTLYQNIDGLDGLIFDADLSFDDNTIYYQMEQDGLSSIWQYNLINSEIKPFLSDNQLSIHTPRVSPINNTLLYIKESNQNWIVILLDSDINVEYEIYESRNPITSLEWSQSGDTLSFIIAHNDPSNNVLVHYDSYTQSVTETVVGGIETLRYHNDDRLFLTKSSDQYVYEYIDNQLACITCGSEFVISNRSWVLHKTYIIDFKPILFNTHVTAFDINNPGQLLDFGTISFPTSTLHRTFRSVNNEEGVLLAIGRPQPSGDVYLIELPSNSIF